MLLAAHFEGGESLKDLESSEGMMHQGQQTCFVGTVDKAPMKQNQDTCHHNGSMTFQFQCYGVKPSGARCALANIEKKIKRAGMYPKSCAGFDPRSCAGFVPPTEVPAV